MSKPNDPYTKETHSRFTLRIPTVLLNKVKEQAEQHKRSTGKEIEFILETYLESKSEK